MSSDRTEKPVRDAALGFLFALGRGQTAFGLLIGKQIVMVAGALLLLSLTLGLLPVFLLGGHATPTSASDITTPEGVAFSHYESGDVDGGRAMFREIFEKKLDLCRDIYQPSSKWFVSLESVLRRKQMSDPSPEEWAKAVEEYRSHVVDGRAGTLGQCIRTLESWQQAEMWLRIVQEMETPTAVASEIVAGATALLPYPPILSASLEFRDPRWREYLAKQVASATQRYGRLLRSTVAFLRGTELEQLRPELLQRARQYADLPESVEEFDLQNPSLVEIFRISIPKQTPVGKPPPTPRRRRLDDNDPIVTFVQDLMTKAYQVDLDYVKSRCVEGYWPEEEIQEALWELNRDTFLHIRSVYVRDIGDSEIEVSVEEIQTVDPEGKVTRGPTTVILRRTPEGEYRVSYFGSEGQRKREREKMGEEP